MQLSLLCLLLLSLFCTVLARPQYKDVDYKLYGEDSDNGGVAIDVIYEVVTSKPPDDTDAPTKHHHHHHHKKLAKTNRLERLKRYLRNL